jgi:hypothetical protein
MSIPKKSKINETNYDKINGLEEELGHRILIMNESKK